MNDTKKTIRSERTLHFEIMRILAAFFVIFNHTGSRGYFLFSLRPEGSISYWLYMSASVFCVMSVPLFFMISGALLLGKEEPLSRLWKKRIGKMAVILVTFMALFELWDVLVLNKPLQVVPMLRGLLEGDYSRTSVWSGYLWYLYAYLAFLVGLPFLRAMVRNLKQEHYLYLLVISLVLTAAIPVLQWFTGISVNADLKPQWLVQNIVLYPLMGYFLEHGVTTRKLKKWVLPMWLVNAAAIAVSCFMISVKGRADGGYFEWEPQIFHDMFVLVNAMVIFLTVKVLTEAVSIPGWLSSPVLALGKCTFGIYLVHYPILNSRLMTDFLAAMTQRGINNMAAVLIQCAAVFAISCAMTAVLRKIPVVKHLVGG